MALADALFFVFEFGLKFFAVGGELVAEGLLLFHVAVGIVDLVLEGDFTRGNLGGVFGVEFGELLFLGGGKLDGGGGFVQTLHRKFVGGFHFGMLSAIGV